MPACSGTDRRHVRRGVWCVLAGAFCGRSARASGGRVQRVGVPALPTILRWTHAAAAMMLMGSTGGRARVAHRRRVRPRRIGSGSGPPANARVHRHAAACPGLTHHHHEPTSHRRHHPPPLQSTRAERRRTSTGRRRRRARRRTMMRSRSRTRSTRATVSRPVPAVARRWPTDSWRLSLSLPFATPCHAAEHLG